MPSRYTAEMSNADAREQARRLGVKYASIPIEPAFQAFLGMLANEFAGLPADVTEENIQARCRGILLMAVSNKTGQDPADHRQQERGLGGLRDALRGHGGGVRADQGRAQDRSSTAWPSGATVRGR